MKKFKIKILLCKSNEIQTSIKHYLHQDVYLTHLLSSTIAAKILTVIIHVDFFIYHHHFLQCCSIFNCYFHYDSLHCAHHLSFYFDLNFYVILILTKAFVCAIH